MTVTILLFSEYSVRICELDLHTKVLFSITLHSLLPSVSSFSGEVEIKISDQMVTCCEAMLQRLREVSPQLDIDGIYNIWIIKPGAKSRGRGEKSDTLN